jgi:hypothetical protein
LYEGNLYFADGLSYRIRKIDFTTGIITTVVGTGLGGEDGDGGQATLATLFDPRGLTFDKSGNMFFATPKNIRKVDTNGIITTVVGKNSTFFPYNFRQALYLSFNSLGNLLITDNFISVVEVDFINPLTRDYNFGLAWSSYSNNTTFNRDDITYANSLSFTTNSTFISSNTDSNALTNIYYFGSDRDNTYGFGFTNDIFGFSGENFHRGNKIGLALSGYFVPNQSGVWKFRFGNTVANDDIGVLWFNIEVPTLDNITFGSTVTSSNFTFTTNTLTDGQKYKFNYNWGQVNEFSQLFIYIKAPDSDFFIDGTGYFFHY